MKSQLCPLCHHPIDAFEDHVASGDCDRMRPGDATLFRQTSFLRDTLPPYAPRRPRQEKALDGRDHRA